jgi:hypothetical protein
MPSDVGQFTIVKFVPDSVRFEPINVGVVVEADDQVVTRMAEVLDPRIRFADPYADLKSLLEFLGTFDAADVPHEGRSVVTHLAAGKSEFPNFYFDRARPIDSTQLKARDAAQILFDRLVRRSFEPPQGFVRPASPTAARTALRRAFQSLRVLGSRVRPAVRTLGLSGIEWELDFEFLTSDLERVQTATTGLKEDLRRREHAFSAFAALVDTTQQPGVIGVLASDEPPERDDLSGQLASMAGAHGLEFVGGQRAFLTLARRVSETAKPIGSSGGVNGLATPQQLQTSLLV